MTDKEIFELWQDNIQKKVAEIDKAIEMLTRLRDSYMLASWPGGLKKSRYLYRRLGVSKDEKLLLEAFGLLFTIYKDQHGGVSITVLSVFTLRYRKYKSD